MIPDPSVRVLFQGDDVSVVAVPRGGPVFVTFDFMRGEEERAEGRAREGGLPIPAYGFHRLLELTNVHVFAHANHWFQTLEMEPALEAVDAFCGAERRITWGGSMGAFGAIQFAPRLRADTVLAFSPQQTVNPSKVPFDTRYLEEAKGLTFHFDEVKRHPNAYVIYDPGVDLDRMHAELLRDGIGATLLPVFHAGHNTISACSEAGVFEDIMLAVRDGRMSLEEFERSRSARGMPAE